MPCGTPVAHPYMWYRWCVSADTLFFWAVKWVSLWVRSVLALGHVFFIHLCYPKDLWISEWWKALWNPVWILLLFGYVSLTSSSSTIHSDCAVLANQTKWHSVKEIRYQYNYDRLFLLLFLFFNNEGQNGDKSFWRLQRLPKSPLWKPMPPETHSATDSLTQLCVAQPL